MDARHDVLRNIYKAFNNRDVDRVLSYMAENVDWPNGMEGGRVFGQEEVRAYWRRQWAIIDPHVEPVGFDSTPDGRTVVKVHQVIRDLNGAIVLDRIVEHIYKFDGDLITKMDIRERDREQSAT